MVKIIFDRKTVAKKEYRILHEEAWADKRDVSEEAFMRIVAKVFVSQADREVKHGAI